MSSVTQGHPKISFSDAKLLIKNQWKKREIKQKPIFLEGPRGVGKTQMQRQISAELSAESGYKVEVKTVILSVLEAPDMNGMPYILSNVTEYGRPHFLPSEGYGILFFDEANRANRDIQNALLTLIEDREINGHRLGDGWIIVLAGNPVTQGSSTGPKYDTRQFDDALKDRMSWYHMEPRTVEVVNFLKNKYGASNKVVSWLICEPNMICLDGTKPTSPRSLEYLIKGFQVHEGVNPFLVAAGIIGSDAAYAFNQFVQNPHTLTIKHLFNITPEIEEIIVDTQKNGDNIATMNYWTEIFVAEIVKQCKDAKSDVVDFLKFPDLKVKTAAFLGCIETADWIESFIRKVGETMEQDEENLKKQFTALRDVSPEKFKKNLQKGHKNA
jgi:hypothetical protein